VNLLVGWVVGETVVFGTSDFAMRKITRQVNYKLLTNNLKIFL
jgi:hypothetical protein